MSDPEFTPLEQELIHRLVNAPQPDLSPDAYQFIHARMIDAMNKPPVNINRSLPKRLIPISAPVLALAAVALVIVVGVIFIFRPSEQPAGATSVITLIPTFTSLPPTATRPAEMISPAVITPEAMQASTPEITPETTATSTLESLIVVEGPVQAINVNTITIYGINIVLKPDDPLLAAIQVGDVLHIEANYDTSATLIVAVIAEPVGDTVNINPDTGEVWRDDGTCGHPPPPWAAANGWRRRCGALPANGNPPGNDNGKGNGSGNGNGGQGKHDG